MKNEDFLEMLGNIDDSIIDECTSVVLTVKKHRHIKALLALAAVFVFTVCAVLITKIAPEGFLTGFVNEDYTVSEFHEEESSVFSVEPTSEIQNVESSVSEEHSLTVEPSSVELITDIETTVPFISDITTMPEISLAPEETTENQLPAENDMPYFVEVTYGSLPFAGTDGLPDDYPDRKRVTWQELLRIYGTVIIPSVIGEYFPGFQSIFNDTHLVLSDGRNTWSENLFRFTLPDSSTLNIYVSKNSPELSQAEEENMAFASEIEGVSVLLLKGYESDNKMIFSAYFLKNGIHFRITQQGASLSEEHFVSIIKSLI